MSSSAITGPILSDTRRAQAGTAAAPSFAFNDSTGTGVYLVSAGVLGLSTNGVQRVVVDASGNVGIGTGSPAAKLHVNAGANYGLVTLQAVNGTDIAFTSGATTVSSIAIDSAAGANPVMAFRNGANTERMRIDANGNLLVGINTPTSHRAYFVGATGTVATVSVENTTAGNAQGIRSVLQQNANNTSSAHFVGLTNNVAFWYLYGNGTTSYTSDARKKKNISTARDGYAADLCKLRVVKYNWKTDTEETPKELGLIAQEVEQVFPNLVQDALDADTDGQTYKVLKGSVLPFMLLKAIQEQQEIIGKLEARLAALEEK
jgi:hypothetical protein